MEPALFYCVSVYNENGAKMADIAKRLQILKNYRDDELKQSNPSKVYLDDLEGSIKYFEELLQKGYTILESVPLKIN